MYDFIGDIHGHASKLESLLKKLGYDKRNGSYHHPERKVFFIGDYIDRGEHSREVLHIVRNMVEDGQAIALMGNHEFNALCFHYPERTGGHLRPHNITNILQHHKTLISFKGHQAEYEDFLHWFKTLPLYYETDTFRAVHAAWHPESILYLKDILQNNRLTENQIYGAADSSTDLFTAVEFVLKGVEEHLGGATFRDKDNHERENVRIKWWHEDSEPTVRNKGIFQHGAPEELPGHQLSYQDWYLPHEKPVFFGHYWWKGAPHPYLLSDNVCCLDFSVADNGHLMAYRFDGEQKLANEKVVFV